MFIIFFVYLIILVWSISKAILLTGSANKTHPVNVISDNADSGMTALITILVTFVIVLVGGIVSEMRNFYMRKIYSN